MLVKIITLFLIGMAVLAMFGRLRFPGKGRLSRTLARPRKCRNCGSPRIGRAPCPCERS